MKLGPFLWTTMLGLAVYQTHLPAQSEGGNAGGSGGSSGISGTGGSPAGGAADHGTGGKGVQGEGSPLTPVPSGTNTPEFHPPPTSASN